MGAQVSREPPPPLPGGYTVGEQVYFTGKSHILENGGLVVHGKQGEVLGPATRESHRGKGVEVLFPGNKRAVSCYLSQVRRKSRRARATHSSPLPQLPLLPTHHTAYSPGPRPLRYYLHTWNQLSPPNPRAMPTCTCTCTCTRTCT